MSRDTNGKNYPAFGLEQLTVLLTLKLEIMKEVRKSDFTMPTEDPHIFGDNCSMGHALQYYGGNEGILISWTPNYHRRLHCEKVNVVP